MDSKIKGKRITIPGTYVPGIVYFAQIQAFFVENCVLL